MFTFTGKWWRFSKYELRDGFFRPAVGAILEEYQFSELIGAESEDDYGDEEGTQANTPKPLLPHMELVRIDPFSPDADEQITAWIHKFGLLGILPHLMDYLEFADGTRFIKTPSGDWIRAVGADSFEQLFEDPASRPRWPGVAHLHDWNGMGKGVGSAEAILSDYFPDGVPKHGMPLPLTAEFWHLYGERLSDVREVIINLRHVWAGLTAERNRAAIAEGAGIETRVLTKESRWVLDRVGLSEAEFLKTVPPWRISERLSDEEKEHLADRAARWLSTNATIRADMVPKPITDTTASKGRRKGKAVDKRAVLYTPAYRVGTLMGLVATLTWGEYTGTKTLGFCEYCHRPFASNRSNQKFCPGDARCQKNGSENGRRRRRKAEETPL